ncbi:CHRD domain-containing protein [Telluribacter sp.]|jgi:hypothetical protein|uniref:CHRD domain-containing protein n=1 Tax=Telluribacter sp. TaxID=1978767 RepID=UPI002E13B7D2|nr:CHRD domain-containing protein [Telluribacter sp.]
MKKTKKHGTLLFVAALMMGIMTSCKDEGPHNDPIVRFTSTINSQNTQPRATSSGQASGVFEFNRDTRNLTYNITYQGLTPTAIELRSAEPYWEVGPIEHNIAATGSSPVTGSVTLTPQQARLLRVGGMYINIPTAQYRFGEVRGQIVLEKFGND